MGIKIILADDHKILRDGLRSLLTLDQRFEVVGEAEDGRSAVDMAQKLRPDVVIMDVSLPGLNGIEATRQIAADNSGARVVALSMHSDRRFVTGMLRAGAAGYLLKECAFKELALAVEAVAAGRTYLSPHIAGYVVEELVRQAAPAETQFGASLTPREREVAQLMSEGHSTRQIAERLCISPKTVETHRRQIMEKLGLRTMADLTKWAIREGLTGLGTN